MNDFSLNLMNSRDFCQIAITNLPVAYREQQNDQTGILFSELYSKAYQMIERGYMVGVLTDTDYYIWMGNTYFIHKLGDTSPDIYKNYTNYGHMMIQKLDYNPYLCKSLEYTSDKYLNYTGPVITLSRSINDINVLGYKQAILEVQVPVDELQFLINRLVQQSDTSLKVNLYDAGGQPLYEQFQMDNKKLVDGLLRDDRHRIGENIVEVMPALDGNLYVVSFIPVSQHYKGLTLFIIMSIIAGTLLILVMLYITYKISNHISRPIGEMCKQIQQIDYESTNLVFKKVDTDIYELNFLAQTISDLHIKLRNSLEEIIKLESYEIQSQLQALQTQMQPHFLYNTIMTMSTIAESNDDFEVKQICYSLTGILRYVAEKNSEGVPLVEELRHLENYVQIMKVRFPDFEMFTNIPMTMMGIRIPKLIIQPLVENSLKYCDREKCRITLNGRINDGHWIVKVCDNGVGFSPNKIRELIKRFVTISNNRTLTSQHIDGMGLENIYMRLKLYYKENMHFKITQNPDGGACVEVGGLIERMVRHE